MPSGRTTTRPHTHTHARAGANARPARPRAHTTKHAAAGTKETTRGGPGAEGGDEECAFDHTNKTRIQPRRANPTVAPCPIFLPSLCNNTTRIHRTKGGATYTKRCARICASHYSKAKEEKKPVETPPHTYIFVGGPLLAGARDKHALPPTTTREEKQARSRVTTSRGIVGFGRPTQGSHVATTRALFPGSGQEICGGAAKRGKLNEEK